MTEDMRTAFAKEEKHEFEAEEMAKAKEEGYEVYFA